MTKKHKIPYDEFHYMCSELALKLSVEKIDYIVAPSRGGLLAGTIISHLLNVPLYPIIWSTRDHARSVSYYDIQEDVAEGKTVVFVDDINDSGKTIESFKSFIYNHPKNNLGKTNKLIVATVLERHTTSDPSDFKMATVKDDTWIVFPYEKE